MAPCQYPSDGRLKSPYGALRSISRPVKPLSVNKQLLAILEEIDPTAASHVSTSAVSDITARFQRTFQIKTPKEPELDGGNAGLANSTSAVSNITAQFQRAFHIKTPKELGLDGGNPGPAVGSPLHPDSKDDTNDPTQTSGPNSADKIGLDKRFNKNIHTACTEGLMAKHAHHHLLQCGHYIVTYMIERCGTNCELGTRELTSPNVLGLPFRCQHKHCREKRQRNEFLGIRRKPYRATAGLAVALISHVYGINLKADEAHRQAKLIAAPTGPDHMSRARTQSPAPEESLQSFLGEPSEAPLPRSKAMDQVNKKQKATKRLRGTTAPKPFHSHLKQPQLDKAKSTGISTFYGAGLTAALTSTEVEDALEKGWPRPARALTEESPEPVELHCLCEKKHDEFMIQCALCDAFFHRGCNGRGNYPKSFYMLAPNRANLETVMAYHRNDRDGGPGPQKRDHKDVKYCWMCQAAVSPPKSNLIEKKPGVDMSNDVLQIAKRIVMEKVLVGPIDKSLTKNKIRVQARVEMEKKYGVHPSQPVVQGDVAGRKRRRVVAHDAASRVAEECINELMVTDDQLFAESDEGENLEPVRKRTKYSWS